MSTPELPADIDGAMQTPREARRGFRVPLPFLLIAATYALAVLSFAPPMFGVVMSPPLPYGWHKALHVFGAMMFVGNLFVTGLWAGLAMRTGDTAILRFAVRTLVWADVVFTAPGLLLVLANAAVLAPTWGGVTGTSWLTASLVLLAVLGVLGTALMPVQVLLWNLAERDDDPRFVDEAHRLFRWWAWLGMPASITPVVIVWLMTAKPSFG